MGRRYNNYHKHTHYSNIRTLDVIVKPEHYIKRAKELEHNTYFTTEHGWGGNVWEAQALCEENNIKCIYAVEAYYVDDRFKDDKSNFHIILVSKNENSFKEINRIISKANSDGYYYKPRIDLELLLSLNPCDTLVTTACTGSRLFKTEDYQEKFLIPVLNHFKDNFFLEVQSHNDLSQINYNKKILELSRQYNIKIIHANDSHYINKEDSKYRDVFLRAKGINYETENGFVLDYPDYDEIIHRYNEQGVLSQEEIIEALNNTLVLDCCESINIKKDIKLPKLHKDSNSKLKQIIKEEWNKEKEFIKKERISEYIEAIKYEVDIVEKTNMEDYFLLDYEIVKMAKERYGGVLTRTGRGSAPSFYINKLLRFTDIDRLNSPITLYPTRFMSVARILESRSLPDIDLNWANVEPVIKASKDILGEDGVYYMIAYKPLQDSSAFRLWCKAIGLDIDEYNEIAKNLENYVDDKKWSSIIENSKIFRGVIESISPSPCSFLLMDKPISEEVGLIKVGDIICCCLDGYNCDKYKYLKNDYLTVSVWDIIDKTFKEINKEIPTIRELDSLLNDKVWDLYKKGITATLNQADSDFATPLFMKYAPKSVDEISAMVAAIRPGFASLMTEFLNRGKHTTGIKELDELLKDSYCYFLYQESIMKLLVWLGVEESSTYDIIKKIAKKKFKEEELAELKSRLLKEWINHIGSSEGFDETWETVENFAKYGFNASHSLSVGYDSLYGAYLKANHPLQYYTVVLNQYMNDTEKSSKIINELSFFNISISRPIFRYSKGEYFYNIHNNTIYKGVSSIKHLNEQVANQLYELGKNTYTNFYELLKDIKEKTSCNSKQLNILIKLDYFKEFGKSKKLIMFTEYFDILYGKKSPKKDTVAKKILDDTIVKIVEKNSIPTNSTYGKFEYDICLNEILENIHNEKLHLLEKINFQKEVLGYIDYTNENINKRYVLITDINLKYTPLVDTYCLNNGKSCKCKISKKDFNSKPLKVGDVIYISSMEKKFGKKFMGTNEKGKNIFETDENKLDWWINSYNIIEPDEIN